MRGSYLNDPCRELRSGEPDDEAPATEPSLAAQDRAEELLCRFVADHPPKTAIIDLARELERFAAEHLDAAKVYAAPPWLSDVAEALGLVRQCDGAPLSLNWNQVLLEIRDQRASLDEAKRDLERLMGDDKIESVIRERDDGRRQIEDLMEAARGLLSTIDKHATFSFGEAEDNLREAINRGRRP